MGTVEAPHFNVDEWEARLNSPQYAAVKDSLREISIYSAMDLFANFAGRASDLKAYTADAQINHDRDLRLQYLAGLGLNLNQSGPIYADILRHKRYPEVYSVDRRRRCRSSATRSPALRVATRSEAHSRA